MSVLSDRLRELRAGQSQTEFAAALGMKYQQYARYEKGENSPSADILLKICQTHEVSADWLLGNEKHSKASIVSTGNHSSVVVGSNNSVGLGESWQCSKCPYKKKFKQLQKFFTNI